MRKLFEEYENQQRKVNQVAIDLKSAKRIEKVYFDSKRDRSSHDRDDVINDYVDSDRLREISLDIRGETIRAVTLKLIQENKELARYKITYE